VSEGEWPRKLSPFHRANYDESGWPDLGTYVQTYKHYIMRMQGCVSI